MQRDNDLPFQRATIGSGSREVLLQKDLRCAGVLGPENIRFLKCNSTGYCNFPTAEERM